MKVAGLWCRRPHEGRHGEEGRGDVALDVETARVEDGRLDRAFTSGAKLKKNNFDGNHFCECFK